MTIQERNQVLKMIADGKITPQECLHLMQALDQQSTEEAPSSTPKGIPERASSSPAQATNTVLEVDPRIEHIKSTVRRLWQIPLWIGIAITVLSALGMYTVMQAAGMNFWFYFLLLPVLLGVLLMAVARHVGSLLMFTKSPGSALGASSLVFPCR
jgi:hypothetical protein